MPGVDYDVHPMTVGGSKYGCWGVLRRREPYPAKDGFTEDGRQKFTVVEDVMSVDCRYDRSLTDPKCRSCPNAGDGEAYSELIRHRGT